METKQFIREQVLRRRDLLSPAQREQKSARICGELADFARGRLLSAAGAGLATLGAFPAAGAGAGSSETRAGADAAASALTAHPAAEAQADAAGAPLVAVYAAMRSEASLARFYDTARHEGWRLCFPFMMKRDAADCLAGSSRTSAALWEASRTSVMAFYVVPFNLLDQALATVLAKPLTRHDDADLRQQGFLPVDPRAINLMAAPLVAFDGQGNRLGYGGGNYDSYLPLLQASCPVVGIAFAEQRVERVPLEAHDLPLTRIISA